MAEIDDWIFDMLRQAEMAQGRVRELVGASSRGHGLREQRGKEKRGLIPILVRLKSETRDIIKALAPATPEITAILGTVLACHADRDDIDRLAQNRVVRSLESSRGFGPANPSTLPFGGAISIESFWRQLGELHSKDSTVEPGVKPIIEELPPREATNCLIAVIDSGIDIFHEAFLDAYGETRIEAIWDQTDTLPDKGPAPGEFLKYSHGVLHHKSDITRYLKDRTIPSAFQLAKRDPSGHGTAVASIAAGQRSSNGEFPGGIAYNAKLIVVIPKMSVDPGDPLSLGYSVSHVQALSFIKDFVRDSNMPIVVNLSQGMNAGAHDGSSALEAAFDNFSEQGRAPGKVIVKAAGNLKDKAHHAALSVLDGLTETLTWSTQAELYDDQRLELWFPAGDELSFQLQHPLAFESSAVVDKYHRGTTGEFSSGFKYELNLIKLHADNGDNQLKVRITTGSVGSFPMNTSFSLSIKGINVRSHGKTIHAWTEITYDHQVRFTNHISEEVTITVPGTSRHVIAVGSMYVDGNNRGASSFSSSGPTRDSREHPHVSYIGENVLAAKSNTDTGVIVESGTSFAAPAVSGALVCLLARQVSRQEQPYNSNQLASLLMLAASSGTAGQWHRAIGYGEVDLAKLLSEEDRIS